MGNLPADYETIAAKLEEVAADPTSSKEAIAKWLGIAAGLLRDVAAVLPADADFGLDKIDPEGTA